MEDASEQSRTEAARTIFEDYIKPQLREPLDAADVDAGKPRFVTPYRAPEEDRGFWRIPVVSRKYSRVVGFFDVRDLDKQPSVIRVSRLPRRPISSEVEISNLPVDVLELTASGIHDQAKKTFGSDVRLVADPDLVFDQAETRVAWKVDIEKGTKEFQVMVTPGYAYYI